MVREECALAAAFCGACRGLGVGAGGCWVVAFGWLVGFFFLGEWASESSSSVSAESNGVQLVDSYYSFRVPLR